MSIYYLLGLYFISSVTGDVANRANSLQRNVRILSGKPIAIGEIPWQVSLQHCDVHSCGGVIYSRDIIITSAECLKNGTAVGYKVRAGSTYWKSGGQIVQITASRIHEEYSPETLQNNIALLRLARSLQLGPRVKPIALARESPISGAYANASGWGSINNCGTAEDLHNVEIPIVENRACALLNARDATEGQKYKITDDSICAGDDRGVCDMDKGGPLVSDNELVGIVSWRHKSRESDSPGVFANVAHFRKWIKDTAEELRRIQ